MSHRVSWSLVVPARATKRRHIVVIVASLLVLLALTLLVAQALFL